jgi:long-subunit acyl-CoA synthetase (AMP-forming)
MYQPHAPRELSVAALVGEYAICRFICEHAHVSVLALESRHKFWAKKLFPQLPHLVIGKSRAAAGAEEISYQDGLPELPESAVVMSTSGSTGQPKLVSVPGSAMRCAAAADAYTEL